MDAPAEIRRPDGPEPNRTPWGFVRYVKAITADPIGFSHRRFERHGDIYYAPVGGSDLYVTRHPDHIHKILKTEARHFQKPEEGRTAEILRRFLGVGLLLANGDVWRRQRRMIQPSMNKSRLESYAGAMVAESAARMDGWLMDAPMDVAGAMVELTLGIVTRVLFDVEMADGAARANAGIEAFREAMGNPGLIPPWVPTPSNLRTKRALRDMDAIVEELVSARRALPGEELAARNDLLSILVAATDEETGSGMTNLELRNEILTMFFAGHETTSNALAWTFHLLSRHPDVENRLRATVREVLGDRDPTFDDLPALRPLQDAISESMRLYPPVCAFPRIATADVDLGDYVIPAGSEVAVWAYWAQHDPRWWDEPEAFRPERFAPDAPESRPGSYVPFGGGQRTCIGKHFALMEATLILAMALRRVHFEPVPDHPVEKRMSITLAPRHGLMMTPRAC